MSYIPTQLRYSQNELNALLFNVVHEDAEGQDIRTLLGAGATDRIVFASALTLVAAVRRPKTPFLAFRPGSAPSTQRTVTEALHRWWIYDEPGQLYWRINEFIPLLSRAYAAAKPRLQSSNVGAVIGDVVVRDPSGEVADPAFDLPCRYVTVATLLS